MLAVAAGIATPCGVARVDDGHHRAQVRVMLSVAERIAAPGVERLGLQRSAQSLSRIRIRGRASQSRGLRDTASRRASPRRVASRAWMAGITEPR